jgi:hypothetical protein
LGGAPFEMPLLLLSLRRLSGVVTGVLLLPVLIIDSPTAGVAAAVAGTFGMVVQLLPAVVDCCFGTIGADEVPGGGTRRTSLPPAPEGVEPPCALAPIGVPAAVAVAAFPANVSVVVTLPSPTPVDAAIAGGTEKSMSKLWSASTRS